MGPSGTKRNMEQSQVKKIHLANDFLLLQFWKNTMWDLLQHGEVTNAGPCGTQVHYGKYCNLGKYILQFVKYFYGFWKNTV